MEYIWLLFEVSFILFSERKNSRLNLCFVIRTFKQNVSKAATGGVYRKTPELDLIFNKIAGLRPAT